MGSAGTRVLHRTGPVHGWWCHLAHGGSPWEKRTSVDVVADPGETKQGLGCCSGRQGPATATKSTSDA